LEILIAAENPSFLRILDNMVRKVGLSADLGARWHAGMGDIATRQPSAPGDHGLNDARIVRYRAVPPPDYVLLLSAKNSQDEVVEGMEAGADDNLGKPVNSHELRVRLRAGERIVKLQAKLLEARDAMRQQSLHDSLTGVWNRAAIFDFLKRELARGQRESTPVSLVMIDLDPCERPVRTSGR
jgi:PleD family two-component response regulator